MARLTAAAAFRKALAAKLKALGHPVNDSVNEWPRTAVEDVTESDAIDKGHDVREIGFVIEVVSRTNYGEAAAVMEQIEDALIGCDTLQPAGWQVLEIYRELGNETHTVGDADQVEISRRTQFRANVSRSINNN